MKTKLKNIMALTLCRWILNIVGNPVCLLLQGHNRRNTEKSNSDGKRYRTAPREKTRQTRTLQPGEETLFFFFFFLTEL